MRPELETLASDLLAVRARIASFPEDRLSGKATNGWTNLQVLDHLALVQDAAVSKLTAALESAPTRTGEDPVRFGLIDRTFVRVMSPRGLFRIPVPSMFEPTDPRAEAKALCLASFDALLAVVQEADGRALAPAKVSSPVSQKLRFGFMAYLEGLTRHARYHSGQLV